MTLVQPALAFTVVVVLALAAPVLGELVGRREVFAACAIAVGIGAGAIVTPARSGGHTGAGPLLATVAVLAAVALAPLAGRAWRYAALMLPPAAGDAFALSSIATKLVTDSIDTSLPAGAG